MRGMGVSALDFARLSLLAGSRNRIPVLSFVAPFRSALQASERRKEAEKNPVTTWLCHVLMFVTEHEHGRFCPVS